MLRFSHVTRCADLGIGACVCDRHPSVLCGGRTGSHVLCPPSARDYLHLCVEQPIGKKLFQLFCRSRPDLQNYISLQDAVVPTRAPCTYMCHVRGHQAFKTKTSME